MKRTFCFAALAAFVLALPAWGQEIRVTSPVAGATWCIGNSYTVTWTKSGTMDAYVSIRLRLRDGGESGVVTLTNSTENDGSFGPWEVPAGVTPGEYLIRVRTTDGTVTGSSEYFDVAACAGPAASITVTSPAAGASWQIGSSQTVTWTRSGTMPADVVIRLRPWGSANDTPAAWALTDSTPNDGSFGPVTVPDSVPEGDYFIRVRTSDPSVTGDSGRFRISRFLQFQGVFFGTAVASRNLEMKSVRHVLSRGGWIVARVKNHINAIDQDVSFRLTFPEGGGPGDQTIVRRVTLAAGAEGDIYLHPLAPNGVPVAGLLARVMVDGPTSQIDETDEGDNTGEARFTILDVRVSAPRDDLELSRLYMQGGWDYRLKFKIRVSHNQANPVGNIRVKWEMFDSGGLMRFAGGSWTIESLASGEEWVKTAEQKFGQEGRSNAHHPKLKKGSTYRVVASITSPDDFSGNNSSGFSFTVPD